MSMAGLSKSRLQRMHQVLSGYVERQEMPGLVALVSHHDDVHVEALGTLAFGDPAPMKRDTIFRIASITKPITAVAARNRRRSSPTSGHWGMEQWNRQLPENQKALLEQIPVPVLFGLGNRHKEVSIEELGRARTRGPLHHPRTLAATGQHSSH